MPAIRVSTAAELLGVSDDSVRRWIDAGELTALADVTPLSVDGAELAAWLAERARNVDTSHSSARNRLPGLVTAVHSDPVMSQVELQCGPFRLVSLMSTEAVADLGLEPGVLATASVKATQVVVEL